jgi:hypothetical protein
MADDSQNRLVWHWRNRVEPAPTHEAAVAIFQAIASKWEPPETVNPEDVKPLEPGPRI